MANGFTLPNVQKREQTAWNIAQKYSSFIGDLTIKAWKDFRAGLLEDWFWDLNVLREAIGHDLTIKEVEELDNMEESIYPFFKGGVVKEKTEFKITVMPYARKIMKILKAQGYHPSKEDRTRLSF